MVGSLFLFALPMHIYNSIVSVRAIKNINQHHISKTTPHLENDTTPRKRHHTSKRHLTFRIQWVGTLENSPWQILLSTQNTLDKPSLVMSLPNRFLMSFFKVGDMALFFASVKDVCEITHRFRRYTSFSTLRIVFDATRRFRRYASFARMQSAYVPSMHPEAY